MNSSISSRLIAAAKRLSAAVDGLSFSAPVTHVYNPLDYAWAPHEIYLKRFAQNAKRVIFVGMNPGPFGMVQTGIPFGEISAVKNWLGIEAPVSRPARENPKRPIEGFACARSEVSGRRLWGLFEEKFRTPEQFFAEHYVLNYCPLAFFDNARNVTPDKLKADEQKTLLDLCDEHLRANVEILEPEWMIGIGAWAEKRLRVALEGRDVNIGKILHPSPASPAANKGWAEQATRQMEEMGIWREM